eukprot:s5215_g2.t1
MAWKRGPQDREQIHHLSLGSFHGPNLLCQPVTQKLRWKVWCVLNCRDLGFMKPGNLRLKYQASAVDGALLQTLLSEKSDG